MGNNSSMIVLGVAAALMLCGMAAAIIVVSSSNDNTMSSDEAAFWEGYNNGRAEAAQFMQSGNQYRALTVSCVQMEPVLESAYEYGYDLGWYSIMYNYGEDSEVNYGMYLDYVENFNLKTTAMDCQAPAEAY